MTTQYQITRDKFFDIKQRNRILKSCDEHAELDRLKGRNTCYTNFLILSQMPKQFIQDSST